MVAAWDFLLGRKRFERKNILAVGRSSVRVEGSAFGDNLPAPSGYLLRPAGERYHCEEYNRYPKPQLGGIDPSRPANG
jgi:hypothetical protein